MLKNPLYACLGLLLVAASAQASGTGLTGNWARNDGATRMAIAPCGANLCATNNWVKNPNGRERAGDQLVLNITPGSGSVYKGQAYDVRRQRSYKITITLQGNTMRTTGCVLLGIICKNADFTRIN